MSLTDTQKFYKIIESNSEKIASIVDFNKNKDQLMDFDFTSANKELNPETVADTYQFSIWINDQLSKSQARYGIGGYNEHRTVYSRSKLFDTREEPRRLHLGTDIWGAAGTRVYAPLEGKIHSFKYNDNFGDYGATIILEHQLDGLKFHTLYGHLNLASLDNLKQGQFIAKGQYFTQFGIPAENGHWPPHLHFQIIFNMGYFKGDYPGVCRYTQRDIYLQNCPDPMEILKYTFK
ncbi:peptidoglycan DD-metalloendopeptidase family protein [Daejeonella oryzae]|uniref:peptidoglycan DD-metalloendopeptidase family protein n=1 Tax=Daejeonella oryzae TaxID=1122943 RepID=UPI000414B78D|nr:peptidoglycan DD-metalloendopeptidase family protein [Daejeonella oryzae]